MYMRTNIKYMITTKIVFDRRKVANRKTEGSVEIRITENRKSYWIATGIRCLPQEWAAGQVVNRSDADDLNKLLLLLYKKVCQEVNHYIESETAINIDKVRQNLWKMKEAESDDAVFLTWCEDQLPLLNISDGTLKHYRPLIVRLTDFGKIRKWEDLTVENIMAFDSYLHSVTKPVSEARVKAGAKPEHLSTAAIYNYHKSLKALLNRADAFGKIDRNPYERIRDKIKRGERESVEYLTEDEIKAFTKMELPKGSALDVAHDLFIFQMFTGLSFTDMRAFNISDYKKVGTKWVSNGERIKTGVPYISSLLPPVVKVLKKYGMMLPQMSNQEYNRQLKALQVMAGIKTRIHSHVARHTFATYMLRNGVKIENVSKMLGHTNITQTQRYAKVLAQSVHDEWDMIAEKLGAVAQHQTQQPKRKKSNSKK